MPAGKGHIKKQTFTQVLPKAGMLYTEESQSMVLCKPKIMPLKSVTLEKLEKMQKDAQEVMKLQENATPEMSDEQ
ncbi:BBSome-interacting protein 1-like [Halichondria panicea]|uniref:BBSome-interacting protein 1-like n=1 Tax=Halichondria panicea TaxID=6063 RepID=UPI00312B9C57